LLTVVSTGRYAFQMPGKAGAVIYLGDMHEKAVKYKAQNGQLKEFDLLASDFNVPYITYEFGGKKKKQDLKIFVPRDIYANIVNVSNTKKHRSKIPYGYDLFLEKTYTKYSYLKKSGLKRLVYHLLQTMGKRLREGHELRMVSDKGEVRLFRPLGPIHDKVMRKVYRKYKNERTINK